MWQKVNSFIVTYEKYSAFGRRLNEQVQRKKKLTRMRVRKAAFQKTSTSCGCQGGTATVLLQRAAFLGLHVRSVRMLGAVGLVRDVAAAAKTEALLARMAHGPAATRADDIQLDDGDRRGPTRSRRRLQRRRTRGQIQAMCFADGGVLGNSQAMGDLGGG